MTNIAIDVSHRMNFLMPCSYRVILKNFFFVKITTNKIFFYFCTPETKRGLKFFFNWRGSSAG